MNITEFCRAVDVSRPTYYKYRGEGMPVDSVEGARAWIAARQTLDNRGGHKETGTPGGTLLALKEALQRANLRKTEAEASLREFESEIQRKNLVSMDEARAAIAEVLAPLRALLDSLPKACAVKANPSDSALAEDAIREGVDSIYKAMDQVKEDGREPGEHVG